MNRKTINHLDEMLSCSSYSEIHSLIQSNQIGDAILINISGTNFPKYVKKKIKPSHLITMTYDEEHSDKALKQL